MRIVLIYEQPMSSLMQEYLALCRQLAKVQERCSAIMAEQAARTERLEREALRLRAQLVRQTTEQAWAREDAAVPAGLPRRKAMARHIADLVEQVRRLTRERTRWRMGLARPEPAAEPEPGPGMYGEPLRPLAAVAADSVVQQVVAQAAAQWVFCQTGCLSHDDYWRVQDHCRRTGQACLLVDAPQAAHLDGPQHSPPPPAPVRVQRTPPAGT
jgi:hypothetical protein